MDENEAVQSFEHYWVCWAVETLVGNNKEIHVGICVNSDGDYNNALQNASSLVAKIMKDESIPIRNVVQHNYFSGKNCPRNIRDGKVYWSEFLQMVANAEPVQHRETVTTSKKYRILTGTFSNRKVAESIVEVMEIRFGWIAYVVQDRDKFRVKTGTFARVADAQSAENKIKVAKLAQVTYILDA